MAYGIVSSAAQALFPLPRPGARRDVSGVAQGREGRAVESLAAAVRALQHRWGVQAIARAGELRLRRAGIATGFAALDGVLPAGGLPRGRITECAAPLSTGATTFALRCIAHAQRHGLRAAYLDLARALDPFAALACGVALERLPIARPQAGREALDIAEALAECVDLLVFDSSGALAQSELVPAARSAGLRRLARRIPLTACALLCITHLPDAASAVSPHAALRLHFARERLQMRCGRLAGAAVRVQARGNALPAAATVALDLSAQEQI